MLRDSFLDKVDLNNLYTLLHQGVRLISDWSSRVLEQVPYHKVLKIECMEILAPYEQLSESKLSGWCFTLWNGSYSINVIKAVRYNYSIEERIALIEVHIELFWFVSVFRWSKA